MSRGAGSAGILPASTRSPEDCASGRRDACAPSAQEDVEGIRWRPGAAATGGEAYPGLGCGFAASYAVPDPANARASSATSRSRRRYPVDATSARAASRCRRAHLPGICPKTRSSLVPPSGHLPEDPIEPRSTSRASARRPDRASFHLPGIATQQAQATASRISGRSSRDRTTSRGRAERLSRQIWAPARSTCCRS